MVTFPNLISFGEAIGMGGTLVALSLLALLMGLLKKLFPIKEESQN
jgi:hypothetical protein